MLKNSKFLISFLCSTLLLSCSSPKGTLNNVIPRDPKINIDITKISQEINKIRESDKKDFINKSIDVLLNEIKSYKYSDIQNSFSNSLLKAVKHSDSSVHNIFFSDIQKEEVFFYDRDEFSQSLSELSIKTISYVISNVNDFGFNKSINSEKTKISLNNWFNENSNLLGESLLIDYFKNKLPSGAETSIFVKGKLFDRLNSDISKDFAEALTNRIANDVFFTGFVIDSSENNNLLAPLILLVFLKNIGSQENYNRVLNSWKNTSAWNTKEDHWKLEEVESYKWFEYFNIKNETTTLSFYNNTFPSIQKACQKITMDERRKYTGGLDGNVTTYIYTTTTYGNDVLNWIKSTTGANKFELFSGTDPDNEYEGTGMN